MQKATYDIVIFLITVSCIILLMIAFIITVIFLYRRKQQEFEKSIGRLKLDHEKTLLTSQLEIQEQTFQHISREIHDNINLSLSLAKLNLNTINFDEREIADLKVRSSVDLITQSIEQLRDLSISLDGDLITKNGFLSAVEQEIQILKKTGNFEVSYVLNGTPTFMSNETELIVFRIMQEACNNIIKHAKATKIELILSYNRELLHMSINDNGMGFNADLLFNQLHSGLKNMEARTKLLGGLMKIKSRPGQGTRLNFEIPLNRNEK